VGVKREAAGCPFLFWKPQGENMELLQRTLGIGLQEIHHLLKFQPLSQ